MPLKSILGHFKPLQTNFFFTFIGGGLCQARSQAALDIVNVNCYNHYPSTHLVLRTTSNCHPPPVTTTHYRSTPPTMTHCHPPLCFPPPITTNHQPPLPHTPKIGVPNNNSINEYER